MHWSDLLYTQDSVATTNGLVAAGCSTGLIHRRVRHGQWQRILPGVVVAHSGPITREQRRRAALLWAGDKSVLSHRSAAVIHGLRVTESLVEISVPHGRRRPSSQFVRTHQSRRPLIPTYRSGLPCTPIARTVVDVACAMTARDDVRALVSDAVQRGLTTTAALYREVDRLPRSRPRWFRLALEEVGAGARSAGEAEFLRLVRLAGLPIPELNAHVRAGGRTYTVDALWRDRWIIVEIDGAAHHAGIREWEADLRRQNALHAAGYIVLRFPVRRLRIDPGEVVNELRSVLLQRAS